MRIVCISSSQIPSDTANSIQVMKVCQSFVQLGHEVTLLVPGPQPEGSDPSNLIHHYGLQEPFKIEWLSTRSRRWFPWKAVARSLKLGVDLLYCWPLQSGVLGLVSKIPSMVELHDFPKGNFGSLWLKLFLVFPGKKRLLPITFALRDALRLPGELCVVSPDGVDLERYGSLPDPRSARKQLNLPDSKTVLCTGHLYPGRGVDLFLGLSKQFPTTSFVWVGGREQEVMFWRNQSSTSELKNVIFTGFVPNQSIPLYQAAADVLLMPYERIVTTSSGGNTAQVCSPMKMFEYMASGRAILTSNLPVLREVLDESMAVFCPPEELDQWVSALRLLIADPILCQDLAKKAQEAVRQYSWINRAKVILQGFQ